ncbi:ThuA domain-containing protein [Microbacterium aurantiacum]|uniref:ThuA domain-containing protein n=1 Tax=Microbacterium aurantiacum TaxID=162393 RepID=UPI001FEA5DF8|nr:ThuA domain-containing protein [Microbacterium aurantiacum]
MMDIEGARDRELLRREDDMRAVIASGSGRYADPWHPFDRTSPLLARVLEPAGFDVEIDDDVDHAMANLQGVDLVVVNAGDPWRSADSAGAAPRASTSGFAAALERGIGVLAVHSALSSLRDYPEWAPAIGGMWVPGLSWHPPADIADITGGELPSGPTIEAFAVFDERYARLQQFGERQVVATHLVDGAVEPTAWVRQHGASRIAVDTLGHDEESYASAGHRALLARLAGWLTSPR